MERRRFLAAAAAGLASGALVGCVRRVAPALAPPRSGGFAGLELNGQFAGWAEIHGGSPITARGVPDVVPGQTPPPPNVPVRFRDLIIAAGPGLSDEFYAWASQSLRPGTPPPASGVVRNSEPGGEPSLLRWQGYVVELLFPALDRSQCGPVTLQVRVRLEQAAIASPAPPPSSPAPPDTVASWSQCRFDLQLDGQTLAAERVGAIACRRPVHTAPSGALELLPPEFTPEPIRIAGVSALGAGLHVVQLTLEDERGRARQAFVFPSLRVGTL